MKPKILFPLNKSYSNILFKNMEIKAEHGNRKIVLDFIYSKLYGIVKMFEYRYGYGCGYGRGSELEENLNSNFIS